MRGRHFDLPGWHIFVNCHWDWTARTHGYRRYPSAGCGPDVRSVVILGLELSWWRQP